MIENDLDSKEVGQRIYDELESIRSSK
jgi:hypothetical protein